MTPTYGADHRRIRRQLKATVKAGKATCWRCGFLIRPDEEWHLGHDDRDPSKWRGPEHARCNMSAGGRKGRARQLAAAKRPPAEFPDVDFPDPEPGNSVSRWSRHWHGPGNPRCPECLRLGDPCPDAA